MNRLDNWYIALAEIIGRHRNTPFSWGVFDCCTFVSDCAIAICGVDPVAEYRGKYRTEIGAKRALIKRHGSIDGIFDACFDRVPIGEIQRGDIVTYKDDEGMSAAAIYYGGKYWAAMRDGGADAVTIKPESAWRVSA